ncbi:MAG: acyl-CoA synthetase [Jatrophihabitans sp.]|nr:MAG: acyl-CoA synthetase [Jatrophihabitans sp.]
MHVASTIGDTVGTARQLLDRAATEARFAATLLQARGPGVAAIPPHRLIQVLRDLEAYGPVGAAVAMAAAGQRGNVAIRDERGDITFGELDRQVNAFTNALRARGFRAGDSLGILARNHRGLYVAILAGAKLGARTLLLNTDFSGPQLADVCRREQVAVLVHDQEFAAIAAGYDAPRGRVLAWADRPATTVHGAAAGQTVATIESLAATAPATTPRRPGRKQRIVLLTSGTTGTPKGAPRDMKLSLAIPGGYLSKIPLRAGRTVMLAAPGFHAWGLLSSMLALGLGNTVVMQRRFDPTAVLDGLQAHRCDTLITVPVLLNRLLALGPAEIASRDLSALRIVAVSGSALAPELAQRATEVFGDVVYNLYGSTEVAFATIATPADLRAAPGTVGTPPHGTVVKLLDPDGNEVPPGSSGRIFVGSSIQFEGYTGGGSKEIVAGLMSTGDVGHLDGAGRLFVDGRDDDMIVSGGENVFPREIEDLLAGHAEIVEAAVVGVEDPEFGQRLRAYVVREPGAGLDEDVVKTFVKENLARYKVPREVVFLDALPRNPAGKVVKRDLPAPVPD